jgi:hypothetical protein
MGDAVLPFLNTSSAVEVQALQAAAEAALKLRREIDAVRDRNLSKMVGNEVARVIGKMMG